MYAIDTTPDAAEAAADIAVADVLARAAERAKSPQAKPSEARARTGSKPRERKYWLKDAIKADTSIPLRARAVGADLAERCDLAEESAFPSYASLMARNGIKSRDTVKRAVLDLEAAGYFVREMGAGNIGQNKYRPLWRKIGLENSTMGQRFTAFPSMENEPVADNEDAPGGSAALHRGGVQDCTPGECSVAPGGSAALHPVRQAEDKSEEQEKEKQRKDAPEGAGSHAAFGKQEDRPSRSRTSREPVSSLPAGFDFDPVDVEAAIAKGHTIESIAKARESFRTFNARNGMTPDKWRDAGRKWIEAERLPNPDKVDPNEMVSVPGGGIATTRSVPRRFVKLEQAFIDSKGNHHSHANPQGVRTVTPPKPDHTRPVPASHPGAVLMTLDWRPSKTMWDDLRYRVGSDQQGAASLQRFLRSVSGQHLADPEAAARQWLRLD